MNVDKNCPKCSNKMGVRCNKCYECGYDYFANYDEPKPLIIQDVSKSVFDDELTNKQPKNIGYGKGGQMVYI